MFKQRTYSIINISGLGVGIACFILIFQYISDELSYDRYNSKSDRIYRVVTSFDLNGVGERSSSCAFPFAFTLMKDYPEAIESAVRFFNFQSNQILISFKDKKFYEKHFFYADSTVTDIFDLRFLKGNNQTALDTPNTVIISENVANKYFAEENPIGKTILMGTKTPLRVTGVFKNLPSQSHIQFDFLASLNSLKKDTLAMGNWVYNPCWTYILLKDGYYADYINNRLPDFIKKHLAFTEGANSKAWLQPLTSIHLYSDMDYEIQPNGNINYIYIFSAIGLFILAIASINFMNLSTARSSNRAREIGMRKTLGAFRSQLISQLVIESVIVAIISLILGLAIVELFMPSFNSFTGKNLSMTELLKGPALLFLIFFGIILGILSGLYPAIYMSSFKPIAVLRGIFKPGIRSGLLRKMLVVLQFSLSITLIACTIGVHCQLRYVKSKKLGFNPDNIVLVPVQNTQMAVKFDSLKKEILTCPHIKSVTGIEDILGAFHNTHEFQPEGYLPDEWYFFPTLIVRENFLETFEIQVVAGRGFCNDSLNDKFNGVVVNEAMVRYMGWTSNEEALGKNFRSYWGKEKIIGVVKDFHTNSLYQEITPFVLNMKENPKEIIMYTRYLAARVDPEYKDTAIQFIRSKWNTFNIEHPFEWTEMKDELDKLYVNDNKLASLSVIFSLLAVFIAFLGLFGLVWYMIESRTREIGIRKVLGSTTKNVVLLLVRSFALLIAISGLIAIPGYIFIMKNWLSNFEYRIEIPWWSLIVAITAVLFIAVATIIFQAVRAARADLVKSLKHNG